MCRSPLTSLSRTPAHEASLVGMILTPYFLSKPSTEAITTEAQSVSGMKPIFTSASSGLSEPAAQTADWSPGTAPTAPAAAALFKMVRRDIFRSWVFMVQDFPFGQTKKVSTVAQPRHRGGFTLQKTPLSDAWCPSRGIQGCKIAVDFAWWGICKRCARLVGVALAP